METMRIYTAPDIEVIVLDNEISLALQSANPPFGPGELDALIDLYNIDPLQLGPINLI